MFEQDAEGGILIDFCHAGGQDVDCVGENYRVAAVAESENADSCPALLNALVFWRTADDIEVCWEG